MEKLCKQCRKQFIPRKDAKGIFCSKRCNLIDARKRQVGTKNPHWKGGRYKDTEGYIHVYKPEHPNSRSGGYIMEHRIIMETKIDRLLHSKEVVHHLNHTPDDNRPDNLMLLEGNDTHSSIHRRLHPYKRDKKGRYIGR